MLFMPFMLFMFLTSGAFSLRDHPGALRVCEVVARGGTLGRALVAGPEGKAARLGLLLLARVVSGQCR